MSSHEMRGCCRATKQGGSPPRRQPIFVESDDSLSVCNPGSPHWLIVVSESRVNFMTGLSLLNDLHVDVGYINRDSLYTTLWIT